MQWRIGYPDHWLVPIAFLYMAIWVTACTTPSDPPTTIITPVSASSPVAVQISPIPTIVPTPIGSTVEALPTRIPAVLPKPSSAQGRALLQKLLPAKMADKAGWTDDILDAFTALNIPYTPEYFCAANAVIEQESSWQGDPTVPGLPKMVWDKIGEKAAAKHIPLIVVQTALLKISPNGQSYKHRIDKLRTEHEMNAVFEDLAVDAARLRLPLNMNNPIRTGGPMQVSVEFAQAHVRAWPYPYQLTRSVRDTVFTRRGGTYFGIAILLQYPAPYDEMIYRFADFNAGRYASRNAAFQAAINKVTGKPIALDGDLLGYANGAVSNQQSDVERALASVALKLGMNRETIRRDLLTEKTTSFGQTELYRNLYALADADGKKLPRAVLPDIRLSSPKITRKLTTAWFAARVDGRYRTCLARAR